MKRKESKYEQCGERNPISEGREILRPGLGTRRHDRQADTQVRIDEKKLSDEPQRSDLSGTGEQSAVDGTPSGHRRTSVEPNGHIDGTDGRTRSAPGQRSGHDGMGGTHEHAISSSGRNRNGRSDIRLKRRCEECIMHNYFYEHYAILKEDGAVQDKNPNGTIPVK